MDLGMAAHECHLLIEEIRDSISEAEVEALCLDLRGVSPKAWVDYVRNNPHVAAYLHAMDMSRPQDTTSYRSAIAAAASVWQRATEKAPAWWPFEDVPVPFSE